MWRGRRARRTSRRPIASSPCSTIPTAIRATSRPRRKFKEISEAYDILKDDQKRAAYDRYGHAAFEQGGGGGFNAGFDFSAGGGLGDIFDQMFGDFMGGRRGGAPAARAPATTSARPSRST